jgi:hypothetical protein
MDELLIGLNAFVEVLGLGGVPFPRTVGVVIDILKGKGIAVKWNEQEKKFERGQT